AEHLASVRFVAGARVALGGMAALEPLRDALFGDMLARGGHARLAEVFLCEYVHGDPREALGGGQILPLQDPGPIRVGDPGSTRNKREGGEGILPRDRVATGYLHDRLSRLGPGG